MNVCNLLSALLYKHVAAFKQHNIAMYCSRLKIKQIIGIPFLYSYTLYSAFSEVLS